MECAGTVILLYNPHTRYVVAVVRGTCCVRNDCCSGLLIERYKVDEHGQPVDDVTFRYFPG